MLRAPPRTVRPGSGTDLTGGAILSATLHGAIALALTLPFSFPAPAPQTGPLEVELVVVEPVREAPLPQVVGRVETPPDQEDSPQDEAAREPPSDRAPFEEAVTARRAPGGRSEVSAEPGSVRGEDRSETEEENAGPKSPRPDPEPGSLAQLAKLVDEAKSSRRDTLSLDEAPGCAAADRTVSTGGSVEELVRSAKTGRSFAQAAVAAQIGGDYQKAIDLYDAAIRVGDLSRDNLAKVYNNRGAAYRNLGFGELAIDNYNEAMRLKPDYAAAYFNRGVAYNVNGMKERAIADLTRSIQLDSGVANPYYQRGLIYAQQAAYEQALSDFSRAIKLAPCLASAYFDRGRVFESLGDLERAIEDFKRSYALDPTGEQYEAKLLSLTPP